MMLLVQGVRVHIVCIHGLLLELGEFPHIIMERHMDSL